VSTASTRFRGASLAARLLVLVVVPMSALTFLAVHRIRDDRAAAARADALVDAVELQQAVANVYPYANLERIALEGLTRIDELRIPRPIVMAIAGVDLEEIVGTNAAQLDAALDELGSGYGDVQLTDGSRLGERLDDIRAHIDRQRALSDVRTASRTQVAVSFDQLDALLGDALHAAGFTNAPTEVARDALALHELADVLTSAGDYGQSLLRVLIEPDGIERNLAVAAADEAFATHRAYVHMLDDSLAGDGARAPAAIERRLRDFLDDVPMKSTASTTGATDPEVVRASRDAILGMFDYLQVVQEYSTQFHAVVIEEVTAAADRAEERAATTQLVLLAITSLTLALIGAVLVSILRPLRRLNTRANAIGQGELDLAPLALRGPSDLRSLAHTMNEMLTTLHRFDDEVGRLAAGDIDPDRDPDVPGAIGESIRGSVRHLASVAAQLQRSEQLSTAIVNQAADAIWTIGADGRIRTANEASGRLTRLRPDAQVGRRITDLLSATTGEAVVKPVSGSPVRVLVAKSVVDIDGDQVAAVIAHDISERTRFEERLAYQASHDALTGLPNRFAVMDRLEQLIQQGALPAVLFIDLDAFKSVNDTHGHAVGDRVLSTVAGQLVGTVRSGEFVGRLGGDEFVVIMEADPDPAAAVALGERIIREVEQPQEHDGKVFVLSASVGVALPTAGTAAVDAIRQADNAVYQAKRRGRGRVELFDTTMQEHIEREAELELALRQAIRDDELVIHLQPVFALGTGAILGAEALVRWMRPGQGMVPPNDFIPIAERSSLIFEVERWVLRRVCERLAEWRRADPTCTYRVAVNISGRHLIEGHLLDDVTRMLAETGADPAMLELELTETQLLEDLDRATDVLDALRSRGITIAVDDFGTGYSSMTYLRHLPIDCVKIDQSFVAHATDYGYDSTVIEALLTIAGALGLHVVAEGIETEEQLEYLRSRGCDRAQGYLLARPMPMADAEMMMAIPGAPSGTVSPR
jgi:diguanylate cyclase (GGDEF)-like protein